jgi:hypothetical protein
MPTSAPNTLSPQRQIRAALPRGLSLHVRLESTIKANQSRFGDVVRFTLLEPVLLESGIVVPKDARLFGRVLGAAPLQGAQPSWIVLVVDRLEWKGQMVPLPTPQSTGLGGSLMENLR